MKKSSAILVFVVAALAFLVATRSAARSDLADLLAAAEKIGEMKEVESLIEGTTTLTLECCDKCGRCDRRVPEAARCVCDDVVLACHPACKRCEQLPFLIYPPRYRCADMSFEACNRKCHEPALQSIIN